MSNLAMMIDFDNMAISADQYHESKFEIELVLSIFRDRGRLVIKRAYADWKKWGYYQNTLMSNAVEMVHVPYHGGSNKNNADIKLAVDAMETMYQNPIIDTFILVSGDSDFQSLITKLRENGKYVITVGVR
ncbi:MAG: NYN domain-containing protein, partial [Thermoplasmata archaeon]|nr:NYN domain-containing protein [Thermoplasmata archaeon]